MAIHYVTFDQNPALWLECNQRYLAEMYAAGHRKVYEYGKVAGHIQADGDILFVGSYMGCSTLSAYHRQEEEFYREFAAGRLGLDEELFDEPGELTPSSRERVVDLDAYRAQNRKSNELYQSVKPR